MNSSEGDAKKQSVSEVVLDASAILAVLFEETGAEEALPFLQNAQISAVNLCEVFTKAVEKGSPLEEAMRVIDRFEFAVIPFDREQAGVAASLRMPTRNLGLSFGDRACVALGLSRGLPVLTAEREWEKLDVGVNVKLIR